MWTIINNLTHKLEDCFKIIGIVKEEREDNKALYRQRNIEFEHQKTEIERLRNELMAKHIEIIHLKNKVDNLNWSYERKPKANDEQLRDRPSTNKFPPTWPSVPMENMYELLSTYNEPVSKSPSSIKSQLEEVLKQHRLHYKQIRPVNMPQNSDTNGTTMFNWKYIKEQNQNNLDQQDKTKNTQETLTKPRQKDYGTRNTEEQRSNQRKNIVIAGDSMLYNIDGSRLSTRRSSVKVRYFLGANLDNMLDFVKPIARMKPPHLILHVGTKICCHLKLQTFPSNSTTY